MSTLDMLHRMCHGQLGETGVSRHPGVRRSRKANKRSSDRAIAEQLDVPVITGTTSQKKRDKLFEEFRSGRRPVLAVSKVANFAVDLPDASVAVQISGTFGSRQEEAQRLGRILRPKSGLNQAHFYTLVSHDTVEQEFALKRQLFLCEQGYAYNIINVDDLGRSSEGPSGVVKPEGSHPAATS